MGVCMGVEVPDEGVEENPKPGLVREREDKKLGRLPVT